MKSVSQDSEIALSRTPKTLWDGSWKRSVSNGLNSRSLLGLRGHTSQHFFLHTMNLGKFCCRYKIFWCTLGSNNLFPGTVRSGICIKLFIISMGFINWQITMNLGKAFISCVKNYTCYLSRILKLYYFLNFSSTTWFFLNRWRIVSFLISLLLIYGNWNGLYVLLK